MGLPLHRLFFAHRDPARLSSFLRRPLPIFAQALSPKRQTGTMEHPSHTLGRSTTDHSEPPHYSVNTQSGVGKAEALQNPKVWGKWSTGALFIGVGIMAYMYSLDGVTTWVYTSYATSSFLQHSLLGAVGTVSAIVIAVGKPVSAKISDVIGRAEAWIIGSAGYAAVQILMQIIIGDVTTLRWRTLSSSLVSAPYFVNGFVGSKIAASVYEESGWRWGYGMFAILFPACAIPIVATLAWSQWKASNLGPHHGCLHRDGRYRSTSLHCRLDPAPASAHHRQQGIPPLEQRQDHRYVDPRSDLPHPLHLLRGQVCQVPNHPCSLPLQPDRPRGWSHRLLRLRVFLPPVHLPVQLHLRRQAMVACRPELLRPDPDDCPHAVRYHRWRYRLQAQTLQVAPLRWPACQAFRCRTHDPLQGRERHHG